MKTYHSYSSLSTFEQCPRKYQHQYVLMDITRQDTEATLWGKTVHDALENRVKFNTPLPDGMQQWEGIAKGVSALPGTVFTEMPVFLDHDRRHCATNGPESNVWLKAFIDWVKVDAEKGSAIIGDWKTGNPKYLKPDQLHLYGLLTFIAWPTVQKVRACYVLLKENRVGDTIRMERSEAPSYWSRFDERLDNIDSAIKFDRWPKRRSGLCSWCEAYKQGRCSG